MSPITFRYPDTCAATNGDALATHFRNANSLIKRPAAAEFFATPLCVHNTAAMLSLNRPTCLQPSFSVPTISSNTSHVRIFPANSRSFISKSPPDFVRRYQPGPQLFWPFQAPNIWFQYIFSWQPNASNNLSRSIYPDQKYGVSHEKFLCRC